MPYKDPPRIMCVVSGYRPKKGINIVSLTDLVLKDKIFVYDLARRRVGWADYDCKCPFNCASLSHFVGLFIDISYIF